MCHSRVGWAGLNELTLVWGMSDRAGKIMSLALASPCRRGGDVVHVTDPSYWGSANFLRVVEMGPVWKYVRASYLAGAPCLLADLACLT